MSLICDLCGKGPLKLHDSQTIKVSSYTGAVNPSGQDCYAITIRKDGKSTNGYLCSWDCVTKWLEEKVVPEIMMNKLED